MTKAPCISENKEVHQQFLQDVLLLFFIPAYLNEMLNTGILSDCYHTDRASLSRIGRRTLRAGRNRL